MTGYRKWTHPLVLTAVLTAVVPLNGDSSFAALVTQTASDSPGQSSWTAGTSWSDGQPPAATNDYLTPAGITLRTPDAVTNPAAFAGNSLSANGTLLLMHLGTASINDLRLDGAIVQHGQAGKSTTLAGNINLVTTSMFDTVETGRDLTLSARLTGSGGLTKINPGTLLLGNTNNNYTGATAVNGGILKLGAAGALSGTSGVSVASGATFDLAGVKPGKPITIAGTGTSGQGALINSGADAPDDRFSLTLTDNATIGGTGRIDIAMSGNTLDGGGFALTKIGSNYVDIRGTVSNLSALNVNQGYFYFEGGSQTGLGSTPITIASGAVVGAYGTLSVNAPIILNGGTLGQFGPGNSTTSTWSGAVTVNSASTISSKAVWTGGNVAVTGNLSGSGALTFSGPYTVSLGGSGTSYTGAIAVNSGLLQLTSKGALSAASGVTVASVATVDLNSQDPLKSSNSPRNFTISGTGTAGQGALINTATGTDGSRIQNLTLTGNALISSARRLDIHGPIDGGSYTLTKTGGDLIDISGGVSNLSSLIINQGRVRLEGTGLGGWTGPITINSGVLSSWGSRTVNNPITLAGGALGAENGGTTTYAGGVTIASDSSIDLSGGNVTITTPLSSNRALTLLGSNTLTLNASSAIGNLSGSAKVALGTGVNLAFGSNNANTGWSGPILGSGSLTKVGSGTTILGSMGLSTYSGGTTIREGALVVSTPGALGTGAVTLDGGTLTLATPMQTVSGFGGSGAGWTLNGGATAAGDVLTVTTASGSQARTAFYNLPVTTDGFTVNFTYSAAGGTNPPADGLAIIFQNDPRTVKALGSSGGALGYSGISPSGAWGINLYTPAAPQGICNQVWINGGIAGGFVAPTGIAVYNTPVDVQLAYNYSTKTLTATLNQAGNTYTKTYTGVDLPTAAGKNAYVGISGGTGGATAIQTVSNFAYTGTGAVNTAYTNALSISAGATGNINLRATPAATDFSLDGLSLGSGASLNVAADPASTPDLSYGLTLGATALAGPATFNVANHGMGSGTLTLAALSGAAGTSLAKQGPGALVLSADNSAFVGNVTIGEGTLRLAAAGTLDKSPLIDIQSGATYDLTAKTGPFDLVAAGQTLQGSGTILLPDAQTATVRGILSAGNSPGTLTLAGAATLDLSAVSAGSLQFEIGTPGDLVRLTDGTLAIGAGSLEFGDFSFMSAGTGLGAYTLFETSQPILGSLGATTAGTVGGVSAYLSLSDDGTDLVLNMVPEPSSLVLLGLAMAGMLLGVRRARSARLLLVRNDNGR
jgi:autotransporter-associated beta strand protein